MLLESMKNGVESREILQTAVLNPWSPPGSPMFSRIVAGQVRRGARSIRHAYPQLSRSWSSANFHPHTNSTLAQVDLVVPKFHLQKGNVEVIYSPEEFYSILKHKIRTAKRRVFLSALYLGKHQTELVECLNEALALNGQLELYVLTDALRGTREAPELCSASLLKTLVEKHGRRVKVSMYHTPALHGVRKLAIPQRFNEAWGLQHMKLYGFDDEIILSGANLSSDYFTNRQDRYILFKSAPLTQYYFKLQLAVAQISYEVVPSSTKSGFTLQWPHIYSVPEPTSDPEGFRKSATRILRPLMGAKNGEHKQPPRLDSAPTTPPTATTPEADFSTVVYPISQFSPLFAESDYSTEKPVLDRLLSMLGSDPFNWTITAGYFNIHPQFTQKLLKTNPAVPATVITASPLANGFYKSKGLSGFLPTVYSQLARDFLSKVVAADAKIDLREWSRGIVNTPGGWSYHAKGLWIANPSTPATPFLTVVGSSNYTRRGYSHDIESNALVVTEDEELQRQLSQEVAQLKAHTNKMTFEDYDKEDRKPDWREKAFIKYMGDKL